MSTMDSIYPPTLKQVHDAGNSPANAKAAACALQPLDPTRTMAFMNELIQEIRAKYFNLCFTKVLEFG